ncbi:antibiotic biosynthesis monooxygenase [Streptomyces sp. ACA25]|uniref:antibiotic biosynthesis monooxygenase n=1 Tax=Streptomyces sp. ACA25 TaxID=3022596 RepID=UPI002307A25D|nr:antibiotic biosynthesis monooxygenase [Streptomyces sp. ACA25]MDB1086486.1 antibiotic biosynthesis monooxygenase [Streptomyces sp. ACA25]
MASQEPATVVFTWYVTPGREEEFEDWLHGITQVGITYPGSLGSTILRPRSAGDPYHIVVRFSDTERLTSWLESDERRAWLDDVRGSAGHHTQQHTGLETWFSLQGTAVRPPPRWKMTVMTFLAVYPLSVLLNWLVAPHLQDVQLLLRSLLFPVVVPPLLTYLIMPAFSRVFRRWLYPSQR